MADDTSQPHVPDHELVRRIGVGSYGEVWIARNVVGTWRAVKVVRRSRFDSDRPYEREFNGIQKFEPISRSHDSQVDILHLGRNDAAGYFYYVMELADDAGEVGGNGIDPAGYAPRTLKDDAVEHRRVPIAECVTIGLALTEALEHLHKNGLVHRDVKPSNIIFIGGRPKLADIGLVTDADAARTFVGTEGFLPPEGGGTPQADLYALGKVLYEISAGKDRRDFPQAPADLAALPERKPFLELAEIIERACDPDPQRRYRTARDMHDDLALIARGESVRQLNQRRGRVAALRRYGGVVATVATVFLLGAVAASWLHLRRTRPADSIRAARPEAGTTNTSALAEYHLGRFWLAKRTAAGFSNALAHFEKAAELDPRFPHALAGRAECFNLLASYKVVPPGDAAPQARHAALAALRLNTNVVEAHLALALYHRSYEWDWSAAEASFRRALALNPNSASAHQWYSSLLSALGQVDEAVMYARRAAELDPSSLSINANLGARLYLARRYQEAIAQYRKVLTMDPNFAVALQELSRVYGQTELLFECAKARLDGMRLTEERVNHSALNDFMLKYGTVRFWKQYAELLESSYPPRLVQVAEAWLRGRETNQALATLTRAVQARDPDVIYLNVDPVYDGIRELPEFVRLCDQLGFNRNKGSLPILVTLSQRLSEAERGAGMTVDEKGAGFRPLFDGQTLQGWRDDATNWVVRDGAIFRARPGGALRYEVETVPDDFELRFAWRVESGGDGGVGYRPGLVEYQVIDASNRIAVERGDRLPGALVALMPAKSNQSRRPGEWNEARIICRGTEIEHWLNGHRLFRLNYTQPQFASLIVQYEALERRYLGRTLGGPRARGGYLQLLDQGHPVWFRHLRWRALE